MPITPIRENATKSPVKTQQTLRANRTRAFQIRWVFTGLQPHVLHERTCHIFLKGFAMELPRRARGDELLKPGELTRVRERLRMRARQHDLCSVIACAFDHRTRMLPFIFADTRMIPAGVRAIGSAMVDAGFDKTRIVLQQWNRNFQPSRMQLDGRIPDLFMVSSMSLHSEQCMDLIRDAHRINPAQRPLIIAGGPHAVYESYD
jgi:hypothetical protein